MSSIQDRFKIDLRLVTCRDLREHSGALFGGVLNSGENPFGCRGSLMAGSPTGVGIAASVEHPRDCDPTLTA